MKLRYCVRAYIPRESGQTIPADSIEMTERQADAYARDVRWHRAGVRVEIVPTEATARYLAQKERAA